MRLHVLHGDPETRRGWASLTVIACLGLSVFAARPAAHDPITTKVTWSKEIVRIVERRCAGCHVAGGVAPMPLQTYEQARPWLKAVKEEVVARRMPKWPAARGFGDFANDRSLSPFEIELIAAWVDGGAPKGDARDLPRRGADPSSFRDAKKQDLTPKRATPPSGERRTVSVATNLARERWATGWRFQPNDPAITQAEFRLADGTYLGHWVPPEDIVSLPPDAGVRLPAGAMVVVSIWYRTARAQQDFPVGLPSRPPSLALLLSASPPAREAHAIDAACGQTPAPDGAEVFAIRPAAGTPQASIGVAIRPPDGPPRVLAWLREFDPSYQATYRLREAVAMPPGTRIDVVSAGGSCHALVQYTTSRR